MEPTLSEQVQLGPSIPLAFEELAPGPLALRLSMAVRQREGGAYSGLLWEARRDAFEVWQPTRQDRRQPGLQLTGCPRPPEPSTGLRPRRTLGDRRSARLELHHVRLRSWGALLGTTDAERRERLGGPARRLGRLRRSGWAPRPRGPSWRSAA